MLFQFNAISLPKYPLTKPPSSTSPPAVRHTSSQPGHPSPSSSPQRLLPPAPAASKSRPLKLANTWYPALSSNISEFISHHLDFTPFYISIPITASPAISTPLPHPSIHDIYKTQIYRHSTYHDALLLLFLRLTHQAARTTKAVPPVKIVEIIMAIFRARVQRVAAGVRVRGRGIVVGGGRQGCCARRRR